MDLETLKKHLKGTTLNLVAQDLETLPEALFQLTEIEVLLLADNKLTELPREIASLHNLKKLRLKNNLLKTLPDAFENLTALEELDLRNNKLKTLPASLAHCQRLNMLLLMTNPWPDIPTVFWSLPKQIMLDGLKGYSRGTTRKLFERIYLDLYRTERSGDSRRRIFEAFHGGDLKSFTDAQLLEIMTFSNETARENTREVLRKRLSRSLGDKPIKKGSQVVFLGTTQLKKSQVKDQLKSYEIDYSPQLTTKTTHVVLGNNPEDYALADSLSLTYLTEQELSAFLQTLDTPFLLEKDAAPETQQNVGELLTSPDPKNIAVGIELCRTGGVPPAVLTGLFYVARVQEADKKLAAEARKLLKLHAPAKIQEAVADRTKLFSSGHKAEKLTDEALSHYTRYGTEVDWFRLALLIRREHNTGLRFLFERTKGGHPLRKEALQMIYKDNTLDLFNALAGYEPDYNSTYAIYDKATLPEEVCAFTELRRLDLRGCRLGTLPENIKALQQLRELDLQANMLRSLPDGITALSKLEKLNLDNNEFKVFPEQIKQLTNLKELSFVGNRGVSRQTRPELSTIPQEIREALPNCKFTEGYSREQESLANFYWKTTP